jgi:hypothetical protein
MPQRCSICLRPDHDAIDRDLLAQRPYRHIAAQYGTSTGALQRHKEHLPVTLTQATAAEAIAQGDNLLAQVLGLQAKAERILSQAEAEGKLTVALQAIREARGCVELLGKLMGEIEGRTTVNVWMAPEWLALRGALIEALAPFPQARQAVTSTLQRLMDGRVS